MRRGAHGTGWMHVRVIMTLGMIIGLGSVSTTAVFTDSSSMTATFSSGIIDITVDGSEGKPEPYQFTAWQGLDMEPGDDAYGRLIVQNSGTLPFEYTMASPSIADASDLKTVMNASIAILPDENTACDASAFQSSMILVPLGTISRLQIGDYQARTLAPSQREILCFWAYFPAGTDITMMGRQIAPVFTLTASQL